MIQLILVILPPRHIPATSALLHQQWRCSSQFHYFSSPNYQILSNKTQLQIHSSCFTMFMFHSQSWSFWDLWGLWDLFCRSCSRVEYRNAAIFHNHSDSKMVAKTVDLRSDTVTRPTDAMRVAMANAEVDDDVLGYDPTALRLEKEVASIMGKEAALFVPSGTMGNLISVLVHCDVRGSEVILGDNSHIHIYENGGISTIGGVHPRTVKNNEDGTMDLDLIEAVIRNPKGALYYPTTRLICLENSHANCGRRCLSVEYTNRVSTIARRHDLKLHIDGARIFNAATALGVPVGRLVEAADSVSVCLSKGLGAPVGSVIVGSETFITKARAMRKTLGGGMRQEGVLCAAAFVALKQNFSKLQDDHEKAKRLADGLSRIEGLEVDVDAVETNIVYFDAMESANITVPKLCKRLEEHGILVIPESSSRVRIVIHRQISDSDVQYILSCIQLAMDGFSGLRVEK
ncbi:Low-specificity L-threonine aldolase 1-like protein [Drosera capensis]